MSSLLPCLLTEAPVGGSIVLPVGRPRALFGSAGAQPFLLDLMRGQGRRSGTAFATLERTSGRSSVWVVVNGTRIGRLHPWSWRGYRRCVERMWSVGLTVCVEVWLDATGPRVMAMVSLPDRLDPASGGIPTAATDC